MFKSIFGNGKQVLTPPKNDEIYYLRQENNRKDMIIMNMQNVLNQRMCEILKLKKIMNTLLDKISVDNPDLIKIKYDIMETLSIPVENTYEIIRKKSVDSFEETQKRHEEELRISKLPKFKPFEWSTKIDLVKLMKKKQPNLVCIDYKKNGKRSSSFNTFNAKQFLFKKKIMLPHEELLEILYKFQNDLKENCFNVYRSIKYLTSRENNFTADMVSNEIDKDTQILMESKYFRTKYPEASESYFEIMLENLIFEIIYPKVFIKDDEDIKARNDQLKDKFYVLQNMVTFSLLEIPQSLRLPSLYTLCQYELAKINEYKAPRAKLDLFSNCAHNLIDVYYKNENRIPSQDDLFPLLVYLFLYTNPDYFQSNINFIHNYLKKDLMMGEYGFLVTSMNAVMLFLDGLDGTSLMEGKLEVRTSKRIGL